MGKVIEVPDIRVYKGGAFHSLRNQKIYKDGAFLTFGAGSGVAKDGDLYVLEDLKEQAPIVEMVTAKRSVSFTVERTSDIEVD